MKQAGIGPQPPEQVVELLVFGDNPVQPGPVAALDQACEFALVAALELLGPIGGTRQILIHFGRIGSGIEIGQIPLRHDAEVLTGGALCRLRGIYRFFNEVPCPDPVLHAVLLVICAMAQYIPPIRFSNLPEAFGKPPLPRQGVGMNPACLMAR